MRAGKVLVGVFFVLNQLISQGVYADHPIHRIVGHEDYEFLSIEEFEETYDGIFPRDTVCKLYSGQNRKVSQTSATFVVGVQSLSSDNPFHFQCKSASEGIVIAIPVEVNLGFRFGLGMDLLSGGKAKVTLTHLGGKTYRSIFGTFRGLSIGIGIVYNCFNRAVAVNSNNVNMTLRYGGITGLHVNLGSYFQISVQPRNLIQEVAEDGLDPVLQRNQADLSSKLVDIQVVQDHENAESSPNGDGNCSICFDEMKGNVQQLQCNHKFHRRCIRTWMKKKMNCPLCRQDIPGK